MLDQTPAFIEIVGMVQRAADRLQREEMEKAKRGR